MQAYVDFFYITDQRPGPDRGAPSFIHESEDMMQELMRLKNKDKKSFELNKENLERMRDELVKGEYSLRQNDYKEAFKTYTRVANIFEALQDYRTASYFHNRCLEISVEYKYLEGEARAYQGLGKAEENVMNKDMAM